MTEYSDNNPETPVLSRDLEHLPATPIRRLVGRTLTHVGKRTVLGPAGHVPESLQQLLKGYYRLPIRSSSMATFEHCPRKFLYESKLCLRPRLKGAALDGGDLFHTVMAALWTGHSEEESIQIGRAKAAQKVRELHEMTSLAGLLPNGRDASTVIQERAILFDKTVAMAMAYWSAQPFSPEKWSILTAPNGRPMVEVILEARIPGVSSPLRGPCDLILRSLVDHGIWHAGDVVVVDFKTTATDPITRAKSAVLSPQMQIYRLLVQANMDAWAVKYPEYSKLCVAGGIFGIVGRTGIKYCPDGVDKAGYAAYIDRVKKWYADKEEKDPTAPPWATMSDRFRGPTVPREFWLRLKQHAAANRATPNLARFYRAGDHACTTFNSVCPYHPLCTSDFAAWPALIEDRYVLERREDSEDDAYNIAVNHS